MDNCLQISFFKSASKIAVIKSAICESANRKLQSLMRSLRGERKPSKRTFFSFRLQNWETCVRLRLSNNGISRFIDLLISVELFYPLNPDLCPQSIWSLFGSWLLNEPTVWPFEPYDFLFPMNKQNTQFTWVFYENSNFSCYFVCC